MSAPGIGLQLRIDIDLDAGATELELATVQLRRELLALDLGAV